jgi:hypothetical protein
MAIARDDHTGRTDTSDTSDAMVAWYSAALELSRQPQRVTAEMRRQHPEGADGRCLGGHGTAVVGWPCSTCQLADAADRMRRWPG